MNVEELVRKVLEELNRQCANEKRILLFIDDKRNIFERLAEDIEGMKSEGFSIDAVTGPGMREYILGCGVFDAVYGSVETEELKEIIERSDAVGVPSIGFSSLARVCMGCTGSLMETAVATALEMGRKITFCIDGCLPANLSVNVNGNYLRMIIGHLKTIVSYGCYLTTCKDFARNLADSAEAYRDHNTSAKAGETRKESEYPYINQRFITKRDILACRNSNGIIISDRASLTDEAKDYAVKEKITIMRKLT